MSYPFIFKIQPLGLTWKFPKKWFSFSSQAKCRTSHFLKIRAQHEIADAGFHHQNVFNREGRGFFKHTYTHIRLINYFFPHYFGRAVIAFYLLTILKTLLTKCHHAKNSPLGQNRTSNAREKLEAHLLAASKSFETEAKNCEPLCHRTWLSILPQSFFLLLYLSKTEYGFEICLPTAGEDLHNRLPTPFCTHNLKLVLIGALLSGQAIIRDAHLGWRLAACC